MDFSERMAAKLKEARSQAHVSAADAGSAVNRSDKTIYAWENNKSEPSAEQLIALCKLYGVDIAYFYSDNNTSKNALSQTETELLQLFRGMSDEAQSVLMHVARIFTEQNQ